MPKLADIEGIGPKYAKKLNTVGIKSVAALLEKGGKPKDRKEIAEKAGVSDALILEWVNHADLYRIKGVGSEYSDLLEEAGVDTVVELSKRKPENLHLAMEEINTKKKLVRKLPALSMVKSWVDQAKALPRKVSY